jgi:excisionase family DNA binding protein
MEKNSSKDVERVCYRPRTVATITDQSVSMVYKLIASGELESVKIGRSVRVPVNSLNRFLEKAGIR